MVDFWSGKNENDVASQKIIGDNGKFMYNKKGATTFPKVADSLTQDIRVLDVSCNQLKEIPPSIGTFTSVEELHCSQNLIAKLPPALDQLRNITILDLSFNQLSEFPVCICHLANLCQLYLSHNRLSALPNALGENLTRLQLLDVSENHLGYLPKTLGRLESLSMLLARGNSLQDVPGELGELRLRELDLRNNQLSRLPCELHRLSATLWQLWVAGNPLVYPPIHLCSMGPAHLLRYLRTVPPQASRSPTSVQKKTTETTRNQQSSKHRPSRNNNSQPPTQTNDAVSRSTSLSSPPALDTVSNSVPLKSSFFLDSGYSTSDSKTSRMNLQQQRWNSPSSNAPASRVPLQQQMSSPALRQETIHQDTQQLASSTRSNGSSHNTTTAVTNDASLLHSLFPLLANAPSGNSFERRRTAAGVAILSSEVNSPRPVSPLLKHRSLSTANAAAPSTPPIATSTPSGEITSSSPSSWTLLSSGQSETASSKSLNSPRGVPSVGFESQMMNSTHSRAPIIGMAETRDQFGSTLSPSLSRRETGAGSQPLLSPSLVSMASKVSAAGGNSPDPSAAGSSWEDVVQRAREKRSRETMKGEDIPASPDPTSEYRESEPLSQLRLVLEDHLGMRLPLDLGAALQDGQVLVHFANRVAPKSAGTSVVHQPQPGQTMLALAKCRRNLENFTAACRKIGVPEDELFSIPAVLDGTSTGLVQVSRCVQAFVQQAPWHLTPRENREQQTNERAPPATSPQPPADSLRRQLFVESDV